MVYGFGLVAAHAAHWQLANAEVDDDQRHIICFPCLSCNGLHLDVNDSSLNPQNLLISGSFD